MELEIQEKIDQAYHAGKIAFEGGRYREAVEQLEQACGLAVENSRLKGEMQTWLVTAYDAAGQRPQAIALCRQLTQHPNYLVRQQAKRVLYILEAPELAKRPEWLTQIPDLGNLAESEPEYRRGSGVKTLKTRPKDTLELDPVDLSQVNTQDNRFIWVALGAIVLILAGLAFWGL